MCMCAPVHAYTCCAKILDVLLTEGFSRVSLKCNGMVIRFKVVVIILRRSKILSYIVRLLPFAVLIK